MRLLCCRNRSIHIFLYNTLYSIIQLCELKKTEKASEMLTALATFYRIGLNRGENIITVEEELSM